MSDPVKVREHVATQMTTVDRSKEGEKRETSEQGKPAQDSGKKEDNKA